MGKGYNSSSFSSSCLLSVQIFLKPTDDSFSLSLSLPLYFSSHIQPHIHVVLVKEEKDPPTGSVGILKCLRFSCHATVEADQFTKDRNISSHQIAMTIKGRELVFVHTIPTCKCPTVQPNTIILLFNVLERDNLISFNIKNNKHKIQQQPQ